MEQSISSAAGEAVTTVPVQPDRVRETVNDQYINALAASARELDSAQRWGELHPSVNGEVLANLAQSRAAVIHAIDLISGPQPGPADFGIKEISR